MKRGEKWILGLTFILALFLRLWRISDFPPALSWDEAAIGYNAYSILETGKDEYGESYPILFKSFNDYKLPGYIYLTTISEKLFGLNTLPRLTNTFGGPSNLIAPEAYPLTPLISPVTNL